MSIEEEKARKTKLIHSLDQFRYGPKMLRALCIVALDVHKINSMTDAELLLLPGIGPKGLNGIRAHLREYFSED
jgi:DNA uptake protein ComE-like DNA-binding protein